MPSPFVKGNKLGHGRPPKSKERKAFEERCRNFMDTEGLDLVFELARRKDRWALDFLADRGWGRATEHHEVTGADGGAVDVKVVSWEPYGDKD